MRPGLKRWIKRALASLVLLIICAAVAGVVYEQVGRRRDRERFTRVGRAFDVGGRTLNLACEGEGSPAVVLESGAGAPGYSWVNVQSEIAKFTHVCSYDRAGYGWSDAGPYPRTSAAIADDLHALLRAAGVAPPYVLVGASFGGLNVRVYAGKYPGETAGVVLVDSSHEDQHEPDSLKSPVNRMPRMVRAALCGLAPVAGRVGLIRLAAGDPAQGPGAPGGMSPEQGA